jgi:hypothetical protein
MGKIPSVPTLMQEYGVAYDTAQHAVQTLEAHELQASCSAATGSM